MAETFSIYFYDVAKQIADRKTEAIDAAVPDIVVTGCPGCEVHLIDTIIRHEKPVKVMYIMELLE